MLTWIVVIIEGDWRLLGILYSKSAEKLHNNYTMSVWHLEGSKKEGMGSYKGGSEVLIKFNSQTGSRRWYSFLFSLPSPLQCWQPAWTKSDLYNRLKSSQIWQAKIKPPLSEKINYSIILVYVGNHMNSSAIFASCNYIHNSYNYFPKLHENSCDYMLII